ncbi:MAG: hypothetical protein PHY80_00040 [Rickettsiales bacterium]|nr:hypothetical protein [Rickettsiales bacterium]
MVLSYIARFFTVFLIGIVAHKIISFTFMIIIGLVIYMLVKNPELLSVIMAKIHDLFGTVKQQ